MEEKDIHTDEMRLNKNRKVEQEVLCVEVLNPMVSLWNSGVLLFDAPKSHSRDYL